MRLDGRRRPLTVFVRVAVLSVLVLLQAAIIQPVNAVALGTGYRIPFKAPSSIQVSQNWHGGTHTGQGEYAYDFRVPVGTPVVAAARGQVKFLKNQYIACGGIELINAANYVTLYHTDGTATVYAHLSRVDVIVGQYVAPGQQIGLSGATGYTGCGPHLHFARQAQGGSWKQSQEVYFEEAPGIELVDEAFYTSANPECAQSDTGTPPTGTFCGKYFKDKFSGPEFVSRRDASIDFNWPGAPGGYWLDGQPEDFSIRWEGKFNFSTTTYYFFVTVSDGVRVYIDGTKVLDSWVDHSTPVDLQFSRAMASGWHTIKVEYYERVGQARISFRWSTSPAN